MPSQANIFHFSGHGLHISYSTGALGSKAGLTYQDPHQTRQFNDQEMRRVLTDLGEEVTVTLQLTVDAGSTTFTLIVPKTAVELNQHVNVETIGITALHRFPLVPIKHGQLDSYSVVKLHGTASSQTF